MIGTLILAKWRNVLNISLVYLRADLVKFGCGLMSHSLILEAIHNISYTRALSDRNPQAIVRNGSIRLAI